jgi:hypothetical protein
VMPSELRRGQTEWRGVLLCPRLLVFRRAFTEGSLGLALIT